MNENEFVKYLNTLHNYNAQNSNVFSEKNVQSKFYKKVLVDIPICDYIIEKMTGEPCVIVLTGHAGDGKTSIMYQVIDKLGKQVCAQEKKFEIELPNGKKCLCIKDYSEFSDEEKSDQMKEMIQLQKEGKFVFLVANTGPLISSFPEIYDDTKHEAVKTKLIDLLDENKGCIEEVFGLKVCLINVVAINNAFFSTEFINKILSQDLWNECERCEKSDYCPILRNINLIKRNSDNIKEFIYNHYVWLSEYGERLTIRNMTQQLSYMITGGKNCADIREDSEYKLLSSNLFFGYKGINIDKKSFNINSVKAANLCHYDKKRWRLDEKLFISKDYSQLFSKEVCTIIEQLEDLLGTKKSYQGRNSDWQNMIKRMYLFYNIETDSNVISECSEDIFSEQFERYIDLKFKNGEVDSKDSTLIRDAIRMLNVGEIQDTGKEIPITLSRESGYVQNVQVIVGSIKKSKIKLKKIQSNHSSYLGKYKYSDLVISISNRNLKQKITLPLLDYFNELKRGIINTNIDAQLSKGLENLKAELLNIAKEEDGIENKEIRLLVSGNSNDELSLIIENGKIVEAD